MSVNFDVKQFDAVGGGSNRKKIKRPEGTLSFYAAGGGLKKEPERSEVLLWPRSEAKRPGVRKIWLETREVLGSVYS